MGMTLFLCFVSLCWVGADSRTSIDGLANFLLVSRQRWSNFSLLESPAQEDSYFLPRVGSKKEQSERSRETIHGHGHAERITGVYSF